MAEIDDKDSKANPFKQSEEIGNSPKKAITEPIIVFNQTSTEHMEVPHHPDLPHKKKKLRKYFLEFLMIFLAVTLGFFAENVRELLKQSNREKEFAQELYNELKDDSAAVYNKVLLRLDKEQETGKLSAYFKDNSLTVLPKYFYPAFIKDFYLLKS